jgi:hypothetical protein
MLNTLNNFQLKFRWAIALYLSLYQVEMEPTIFFDSRQGQLRWCFITIMLMVKLFTSMNSLNQLPNDIKIMNLEHNANLMALELIFLLKSIQLR